MVGPATAGGTVANPNYSKSALTYHANKVSDPTLLLPFRANGRWGYLNRSADVVILPSYEWVDYFYPVGENSSRRMTWRARAYREGRCIWLMYETRKDNGGVGSVREYDLGGYPMGRVSERFYTIWAAQGDKQQYGLYGADRDTAIPISRPGILEMSEGLAAVDTGDGVGFVNRLGDMLIEPRFSVAYSFQEGLAAVKISEAEEGRWGFLQKSNRLAFVDRRGEIEQLRSFSDGMAALRADGRWGFISKRYKVRIKPSYDEVRDFFNGRAAVRQGDEWGYIDKRGKKLAWGFQKAWDFPADDKHITLALVQKKQAYIFIDGAGKTRINPGPGRALPFVRETARVECGGSFGYIDSSGRLIYDPRQYEEYGIRGWDAGKTRPPVWTGLWNSDGELDAPFPLEADVANSLPFNQTRRP